MWNWKLLTYHCHSISHGPSVSLVHVRGPRDVIVATTTKWPPLQRCGHLVCYVRQAYRRVQNWMEWQLMEWNHVNLITNLKNIIEQPRKMLRIQSINCRTHIFFTYTPVPKLWHFLWGHGIQRDNFGFTLIYKAGNKVRCFYCLRKFSLCQSLNNDLSNDNRVLN